ncbi:hypothetical protein X801_04747, partial [Opisthorchis viverrini]
MPDNPTCSETRGQTVVQNHVVKSEGAINPSERLENSALDLRVNGTPTRYRANETGSVAAFPLMSPINLNQPAVVAIRFLCFKLVYEYPLYKLRVQSATQNNHRKGRNSARSPPKFYLKRPPSNLHYHTFDCLGRE